MATFPLIDQQSIRAPHINEVSNRHALQVLRHFPSLRKLGVNILEVNLLKNMPIMDSHHLGKNNRNII